MKTKINYTLPLLISVALFAFSLLQATGVINVVTDPKLDTLEQKISAREKDYPEDRIYLTTNQPIYSPGEQIWFSAFVRNGSTLKPSLKSDIVHIELINPAGKVQQTMKLISRDGYCSGDLSIAASLPGGYYKLRAYTNWMLNESDSAGYTKEVLISKVILPRLKMNLTYDKDSYTKGEEVLAKFSASTNQNLPLTAKSFSYEIQMDGTKIKEGTSTTGNDGVMFVRYNLPEKIKSKDALMIVKLDFEGTTESISRSIPISMSNLSLHFFPEGGDMVDGLPGRIAFRAKDEFEKAISVEGIVKDSKGNKVADFTTFHKGMGAFTMMPVKGETYTVTLTKPEGVEKTFSLPNAVAAGFNVELSTEKNAVNATLRSTGTFKVYTVAMVRGKVCYSNSQLVSEGENHIEIPTANFPMGVAQVTFFDQQMIPRCERLVFVNRERQLNVSIKTDKDEYQTRDRVHVTVRTTDENGIPVPAILSVKAVNDQLMNFADDKSGNILTAMLLEGDLKQKVEESNFYFDKSEAKGAEALDYLLMTSGWRRFSWKQILKDEKPIVRYNGEKANVIITTYDGYTGKILPNTKIKIGNSRAEYFTDANGKVIFNKLNLYEPVNITASLDDYTPATTQIVDYNENLGIWLYNPKNEVYMYKDAPDMREENIQLAPQMNFAAPMGGMVMDEVMMIGNGKAGKKNKGFDAEGDMVVNEIKFTPPIETKTGANKDENKNGEQVIDQRLLGILAADSIAVKDLNNNQAYYRTREFPQKSYSSKTPEKRTDFASTLYFNGAVETDYSGKADFTFTTNDLISSFRIIAEGIGDDGLVGRGEKLFFTQLPFSISAKIPGTLTGGDQMQLPIVLKNNTLRNLTGKLSVHFSQKILNGNVGDTSIAIAAQSTKVIYWNMSAHDTIANDTIQLAFVTEGLSDETTVPVAVDSKGFPVQQSFSGRDLEKNFKFSFKDALKGSLKVSLTAYPSTVSTLLGGLSGLLRMPGGCFEQTSMSSYPNAMIMNYLKASESGDEATYAHAKELLKAGYEKLVTFETKQKGYEWFGSAPGHEALSAYGLMQFADYKKLYAGVDEGMVTRTADWLFARRDGKGGYQRNDKACDYFGRASEDITNLYITYALSEAGYKNLQQEVDYAYTTAKASDDNYLIALAANTLYNMKDNTRGDALLTKILGKQKEDGSFDGKTQSIVCSGGQSLTTETSSLSLLAILASANPSYQATQKVAEFLTKQRSGYGEWGNTQATILALKALSKFSLFNKRAPESGTIQFLLDDVQIAEVNFAAGDNKPVEIKGLEKFINEGDHDLKIRYKGCKVAMPYSISITYNIATPKSAKDCNVSLNTSLATNTCKVGDNVRLSVTLKNETAGGLPSTMAIVGIPAGLSLQPWQLKELKDKKEFDYFEIMNNNLVLYYRQMKPSEVIELNFDLKAEVPGTFEPQASDSYLYYTSEFKCWTKAEKITITK